MFIKENIKKVGNKIYTTTLLVEGYRENGKVKHNTISNLTKWPSILVDELKKIIKGGKVDLLDDLENEQGKAIGALYVLHQIAKKMGIIKVLGSSNFSKLVQVMIYGRILNQGSRLSLVSWQNDEAIPEVIGIKRFNEDQLYYAMDWLYENQDKIERDLFKHRSGKVTSNFYLYDVTSSYLEGLKNELAEYGYNRDGKRGKKQIVVGLLTDDEGMPVAIRVFKGNTQDPKTVETQLGALTKQFNVENLIFVGDRGMIKKDQQKEISSKENWYWITAITKPQINTLLKEGKIQLELLQEEIAEVVDGNIRYIIRRNPIRAGEIKNNRNDILSKFKEEVDKKNKYLKEHTRAEVSIAEKNLNSWISRRKLGDCVTISTTDRTIKFEIINENVIKKGELDGCYIIKTNVPNEIAGKEAIHSRYKDLAEVEQDFRNLKTFLLELRPIFHRKATRTRALAFIAMLALMITKFFDKETLNLGVAIEYKLRTLDRIQYTTFKLMQNIVKKIPNKLSLDQEQILSKLNISLPRFL